MRSETSDRLQKANRNLSPLIRNIGSEPGFRVRPRRFGATNLRLVNAGRLGGSVAHNHPAQSPRQRLRAHVVSVESVYQDDRINRQAESRGALLSASE